jgi:hypothetical protein
VIVIAPIQPTLGLETLVMILNVAPLITGKENGRVVRKVELQHIGHAHHGIGLTGLVHDLMHADLDAILFGEGAALVLRKVLRDIHDHFIQMVLRIDDPDAIDVSVE